MGELALEVLAVGGPVFVQDAGRPGRMHEGIPPGGALVPELLAAANRAVGNAAGEAALELYGSLRLGAAGGALEVSIDGDEPRVLAGAELAVARPDPACVRYVAVAGGLDVPVVLGGRGTLLVAGLGGVEGRALRAGDRIPVGPAHAGRGAVPRPGLAAEDLERPLRVISGPDLGRFGPAALEMLCGSAWVVAPATDRTGMRLGGPAVPRLDDDVALSAPMVRGAIQITGSGEPIVLGPDHPTTGGYPVLATVIRADHGALAARRPGSLVRFVVWELPAARAAFEAMLARSGEENP